MSKKLLFKLGKSDLYTHTIRFGEYGELIQCCYFKGKELGYEDGDIYLQWFDRMEFNSDCRFGVYMECPSYSILPIKFIRKIDIKEEEFDRIIDLNEIGTFYENSLPMYVGSSDTYEQCKCQKPDYSAHLNYRNIYYYRTGKRPVIDLKKDTLKKPYILFHIRLAPVGWGDRRNSDLNLFRSVILTIKEKYGDKYEIWKCGESCRGLDKLFDFIVPYHNKDINEFIKLINNCSLFIGSPSGPLAYVQTFGIPTIILGCPKVERRGFSYYHEDFWELQNIIGKCGKTILDWLDMKTIEVIWKDEPLYESKISEFTKKWL